MNAIDYYCYHHQNTKPTSLLLRRSLPILLLLMMIIVSTDGVSQVVVDTAAEASEKGVVDVVEEETVMLSFNPNNNNNNNKPSSSALQQAQELHVPQVTSTSQGETENIEFWENHEDILKQAWQEWSSSSGSSELSSPSSLPSLDEIDIINTTIYNRIHEMWEQQPPTQNVEDSFKEDFLEEPIPGVYTMKQFITPTGITKIRQHLDMVENTNIPTRRPNGMNRFGIVIDNETPGGVWYPPLSTFRTWLVDTYVRPLGRMLFQEYIGSESDDSSAYAFTIQYSHEHDIALKEHSDASVFTMNINLNDPTDDSNNYEGSSLMFRSDDDDNNNEQSLQEVVLEPGMAVLHRGLHRHQALPIQKGNRLQLVIWLFGEYGYVRFAPYEDHEQMSIEQRWSKSKSSSSSMINYPTYDDDDAAASPDFELSSSSTTTSVPTRNSQPLSSSSSLIQNACWNLQAYD